MGASDFRHQRIKNKEGEAGRPEGGERCVLMQVREMVPVVWSRGVSSVCFEMGPAFASDSRERDPRC